MGEQRGFAPLLTVDLASVTVELNLCESGARFPCKWSSVLEIYILLRYGPKDVAKYVEDDSTVSKYYGTLPFYQ